MRNLPDESSLFATTHPRFAKIPDALSFPLKDIGAFWTVYQVHLPLLLKNLSQHLGKVNDTAILVLGRPAIQSHRSRF